MPYGQNTMHSGEPLEGSHLCRDLLESVDRGWTVIEEIAEDLKT
jgi:hypothetical protein